MTKMKRVNMNIPETLHNLVKSKAEDENRTFTDEVIKCLEEVVGIDIVYLSKDDVYDKHCKDNQLGKYDPNYVDQTTGKVLPQ